MGARIGCVAVLLVACGGGGGGGGEPDGARAIDARSADAPPPDPALEVMPDSPVLFTPYDAPIALPFACMRRATGEVITATWSLSSPRYGTIAGDGTFTPGAVGGLVDVTCADGAESATTTMKVVVTATENVGVSAGDEATLRATPVGAADPGSRLLYPNDETVFPLGIPSPELQAMFNTGGSVAAIQVHISTDVFAYDGFFAEGSPFAARATMAQAVWQALGDSEAGQRVEVRITRLTDGVIYGPLLRHFTFASAPLQGVIYYATENSPMAGQNGAIYRAHLDATGPELQLGNCTTCHSASADGTTLAAGSNSGGGGLFALGASTPIALAQAGTDDAYAALYPHGGEVAVIQGRPGGSWPPNTPGVNGQATSLLEDRNGSVIASSGIESFYAQTPAFSDDGTELAFVDRSATLVGNGWPGPLVAMDFDHAGNQFSGYHVLATPPLGRNYAWPAFTPDGGSIVFQSSTGEDLATWSTNVGDLFALDPNTGTITALPRLAGDDAQGVRDLHLDYEPSFLPVASGGYYWLTFTSRRTYGNELTGDRTQVKQVWIAAYDPGAAPGVDPSHPPFLLAAQEHDAGNHHPQWTLAPPAADGATCTYGDECASGYCDGTCGAATGCSDEFERCGAASDCCDAADACVNGYCGQVAP